MFFVFSYFFNFLIDDLIFGFFKEFKWCSFRLYDYEKLLYVEVYSIYIFFDFYGDDSCYEFFFSFFCCYFLCVCVFICDIFM